jgi:xanthine dehydrogenase YagT iron-sulfur-binding subunit
MNIVLSVNGRVGAIDATAAETLLDVLRERLQLTGAKRGCENGACGACTVLADGRPIYACLTLAAMAQGKAIVTIEGLADGGKLHPLQQAFIVHDALQCGFCTPGQIMTAVALLDAGRLRGSDDIREQMSGNLCRCGAYPGIVAAIESVAQSP